MVLNYLFCFCFWIGPEWGKVVSVCTVQPNKKPQGWTSLSLEWVILGQSLVSGEDCETVTFTTFKCSWNLTQSSEFFGTLHLLHRQANVLYISKASSQLRCPNLLSRPAGIKIIHGWKTGGRYKKCIQSQCMHIITLDITPQIAGVHCSFSC